MTLIYFILVLGITVFIHELGHFIFAKRAGIYVYEFSIGMGPQILKFNRKNDETMYSLRLFPIGGFVSMSGEEIIDDENVPSSMRLQSKSWVQRLLVIIAGVLFNFILAIILLFVVALISGAPNNKPYIAELDPNYYAYKTELKPGDLIVRANGKKVRSIDRLLLEMQFNQGKDLKLEVIDKDDVKKTIELKPTKEIRDESEVYLYGFSIDSSSEKGIGAAIKYAFVKTGNLIEQMVLVIQGLVTGKLKLNSLAGPVGIFNIVGESAKAGLLNLVYLVAFLSINVGFVNLMPLPALDGGRLLFLIIEKIKGSPINAKTENIIHAVGLVLLLILTVIITYNDILRLFK